MYDVTALGELLIDFTQVGLSEQKHQIYEQNPGGAPANVLACLSRLGRSTALIAKVGSDEFGRSLKATLETIGIATQGLVISETCHTTLAFVHLNEQGDRSFTFYRSPGADMLLEASELSYNLIDDCQIFHVGSVSMTHEPARQATFAAIHYARDQGKLISFDPNLRLQLWASTDSAQITILQTLHLVDILKVSEEELVFLTDDTDLSRGAEQLYRQYNLKILLVTRGENGAMACNQNGIISSPAYQVKTIDTTGAGDAFCGAFLYQLLETGKLPHDLTEIDLSRFLAFANAAASLSTTRSGAMPAMPTLAEIRQCMENPTA